MYKSEKGAATLGIIIVTAILAAVISSFITYKATAGKNMKFAVIDLQRVVVSSKDIEALKTERDTQIQDLKKMADDANEKIQAITDEDEKKQASEKYLAEINAKKEGYDKVYASALQASDQKLNDIINAVADKKGLNVVFNKTSLIQGGEDITDAVVEMVK